MEEVESIKARGTVPLAFSTITDDIYELNETNTVTTRIIMRLSELAGKAVESQVDAIQFTCSFFTPYVKKIAESVPVPVRNSDISMLEKAVESSDHIFVIATVRAAGLTSKKVIQEVALKKGKDVTVEVRIIPEAFNALQSGDASCVPARSADP